MSAIERGATWTAEHMRECLYRYITRMAQHERQTFYAAWAKYHGEDGVRVLQEQVRAWES